MNTNFLIDDTELREAQVQCADFTDKDARNRAIANVFAAKIAKKFFEEAGKEFDSETSLQCIEGIAKKYDISDVYVNGNYVDIRLYFNDDEIGIPAQHFNDEMLPLAYMFIKMQNDLSQAEVTGFILPDTITVVDDCSDYYSVNENALIPFEEIEYLFRDADDLYNVEDAEIYEVLDESTPNTSLVVRKLLRSYDGRKRFIKACHAQSVLKGIEISINSENTEEDTEITFAEKEDVLPETEDVSESEESYDFSTVVSPNLPEEIIDDSFEENSVEFENLELELNNADITEDEEAPAETENEISAEEIETLFESEDTQEEVSPTPIKRKTVLPMLVLLLLLAVGGYFGYTKLAQPKDSMPSEQAEQALEEQNEMVSASSDAMPVETVEKAQESVSKNEGNSVSIPAIEQNLDASILVSNLRIDWEVPSGYVTNTQAKRYLVKLGKIIQLNLKAELLLLNKPPITNRITVELKYNKTGNCFETVGIVASSGESAVDNLILQTVNKALETKLNISTESFEKLSGNPVLVIKL